MERELEAVVKPIAEELRAINQEVQRFNNKCDQILEDYEQRRRVFQQQYREIIDRYLGELHCSRDDSA